MICHARSGSTLLRFLLDTHPELACPPETNLPGLCAQLATVWSLIEGAPLSANRGDEPPEIPQAAIAGIRHTMDRLVGSYLGRRGKLRYCDKSLGTARYADLLARVYPQAKFVCLYRHPMDVIASGMEACPWGLSGFGFDQYISETPGNAVLALARFWADNTALALAVEERFPERCHRVRYEDLVTTTEETAAGIFSFLGASPVADVSTSCFSNERERFGPGDYKIWRTSEVTDASVGRGWSVPAQIISPPVLASVNELVDKLSYLAVDDAWGTSAPPADLRRSGVLADSGDAQDEGLRPAPSVGGNGPASTSTSVLGRKLRESLVAAKPGLAARWGPRAKESFVAVAIPDKDSQCAEYWLVDLDAGTVTPASQEAQNVSGWDIVGPARVWERIVARDLNLNVALRSCQLRYCDDTDAGPVTAGTRLDILASLLGLAAW
ncbi:MAG: sulfotransferase family protein [Trebonia sp.]